MSKQNDKDPVEGALSIQVELTKTEDFNQDKFIKACEQVVASGWAESLSLSESEPGEEGFVRATFETKDSEALWERCEPFLYGNADFGADLRAASIAARTGERGWDDYVLLSSFAEEPDEPEPSVMAKKGRLH